MENRIQGYMLHSDQTLKNSTFEGLVPRLAICIYDAMVTVMS